MDPVLKRIGDVTIERVSPQKPQHSPPSGSDIIEDLDSEGSYSEENLSDEDIIDLDKQEECVRKNVIPDNIIPENRDFTYSKSIIELQKNDSINIRQSITKRKFSDSISEESDDTCKKSKQNENRADILDYTRSVPDINEKENVDKDDIETEDNHKKLASRSNDSADELTDDEYESSDSETERDDSDVKKMKMGPSGTTPPIDLEKTDFIEKLTQGLPFDGTVLTESSSSDKVDPDSSKIDTSENTDVASDYDYDITEKLREMGEISVQPVKKGELTRKPNIDEPKSEISVTATKNKHGSDSDTDDGEKLGVERKIGNMRRNIREVMDEAQLDEATLAAQRQEMERLRRVQEQQRIIREVQRQIALNRQNQKTQHRVISLLQGNSSIIKQVPSGSTPSSSRVGSTVLVKLANGETKPMTRLPKGHTPFEMVRVHKASGLQNKASIPRNLINVKGNLTPSVSIAPVAKKPLIPPPPEGTEVCPEIEDKKPPKQKKDVVTISSSSDDDCIILSEDEEPEPEPDEDPCNSGMHTNDAYNTPDEQGRVLVNVGHPENEADIFIASQIARVIKPHQIGGVRFLFDNVIESTERFNTSTGFGCILAHSMGLGKTLQVVCFSDIFLRHTSAKTILCIMPINTLQNWMAEFNMWLPTDAESSPLKTHGEVRPRNFALHVLNDSHKSLTARAKIIQEWNKNGGVLLIGYELYRLLSLKRNSRSKKKKKPSDVVDLEEDDKNKSMFDEIHTALVKPGPDLVICDEGHRIKNSHASISQALKQIRSKRRVVLTGYPLQNNLLEYWCMVDFVRPNYLGTKTEFCNMFERPIQNGQCIDSTPQDIRLMRYRAHVLHSLLEGFVQRRSHVVLQQSLPQKEEYVMLVRMTSFQRKLYDTFMNEVVRTKTVPNPLKAFAVCCKIWNHPDVLYYFLKKREREDAVDIDLEEVSAVTSTTTPTGSGKKNPSNETGTPKRSRARSRPAPKRENKKSPKQIQTELPSANTPSINNNKPAASVLPNTSNSTSESASSNITSDLTNTSYNSNSSDFAINNQLYSNLQVPHQQQLPHLQQPPQQSTQQPSQQSPQQQTPQPPQQSPQQIQQQSQQHPSHLPQQLPQQHPQQQHPQQQHPQQQHPQQQHPQQQHLPQQHSPQQHPTQQHPTQQHPPQQHPPQQHPPQQHPPQQHPPQQHPPQQHPPQQHPPQQHPPQQHPQQHPQQQQSQSQQPQPQPQQQTQQPQQQSQQQPQSNLPPYQNPHPPNAQNYGAYPQPPHPNPDYYNANNPYPPNNQYNNYYPNPNAPPGTNYSNSGYFGPNQGGNPYNANNWTSSWNNEYSQPYNQSMQEYGRFGNNLNSYPQSNDNTENQIPPTQNVSGTFENNTPESNQYNNSQTEGSQTSNKFPEQFSKTPLNGNNSFENNMYNSGRDSNIKTEQTNRQYPTNQPNTNYYNNSVNTNYNSPVKNESESNFQYNNTSLKTETETSLQDQPYNRQFGNQFDSQNNPMKLEPNIHPQPVMNYYNESNNQNTAPFNSQNNIKTNNEFPNSSYNYNSGDTHPPYPNHNYFDSNQYGHPPPMYNQNMYPQQNYNSPYGPPPPLISPSVQNCSEFVEPKVESKLIDPDKIKSEIKIEDQSDILKPELNVKNENDQKSDSLKQENMEEKIKNEDIKEENIKDEEGKCEEGKFDTLGIKANLKEDAGIPYDWAVELLKGYIPGCIENSAKMEILFCILSESMALGDRILLFSQSLFTLNLIEEFLQRYEVPGSQDKWARNVNYYRLDGSTSALEREKLINEFNSNPNIHLFMVSTRAGSLGINLVGANRVIVFDASWNPCHDTQAVCRVYRYGQKKPCFVYRLVMDNCLEKKIYDRQINKQGMADRVVDECNPDAHLSMKDVTNLCWDDEKESEIKDYSNTKDKYIDVVMQKVLDAHSHVLSKEPFQHESLLVDRKEKKLSQAEKRQAKRSYELEKKAASNAARTPAYAYHSGVSGGTSIVSMHRRGMVGDGAMHNKPIASVRPMQAELNSQLVRDGQRRSRWIPAEVWQRQGMTAQEMTLPLDVVIPTNGGDRGNIVLKAGQKVLVLKSPKGIYMQLECGKIVAIRTAMKVRGQATNQTGVMKASPSNPGIGGPPKSSDETSSDGSLLKKPNPRMTTISAKTIPLPLKNNSAVTIIPKANPQKIVKPFTQVSGYAKLNRQMQNSRNINARIQNIRFPNNKTMNTLTPSMHQKQIQLGKAKPFNLSNRNIMEPEMVSNTIEPKIIPRTNSNEPETHIIHSSDEEGPDLNMSSNIKTDNYSHKSTDVNDAFTMNNMRDISDMNESYDSPMKYDKNDQKQNEDIIGYCDKPMQRNMNIPTDVRTEIIPKEVTVNKVPILNSHFKCIQDSGSENVEKSALQMEMSKSNSDQNFNLAQIRNDFNENPGSIANREDRYERFIERPNMRNEYNNLTEYNNFSRHSEMAVDFSVQQRIQPDFNEKSQVHSGFNKKTEYMNDFTNNPTNMNSNVIPQHDIHLNTKRYSNTNPYYKEKPIMSNIIDDTENNEMSLRNETNSDMTASAISHNMTGKSEMNMNSNDKSEFRVQKPETKSDITENIKDDIKNKYDMNQHSPRSTYSKPESENTLDISPKSNQKRSSGGFEILEVKSLDKNELIDVDMVAKSFENVHESSIIKTDLTKPIRPSTPKSSLKNYRHNFSSQKAAAQQQRFSTVSMVSNKNQSALHRLEQTTSAIGTQPENCGPSLQKSLDNITSDGITSQDNTVKASEVKSLQNIENIKKTQSVLPLKEDILKEPQKNQRKSQCTTKPTKLNLKETNPQTIVLDSDNESPTKGEFAENQPQPQNYNRIEPNPYEYAPYGAPPINTGYYGAYNQMHPHPPYGPTGSIPQSYYSSENIGNQYNSTENANASKTSTQTKQNNSTPANETASSIKSEPTNVSQTPDSTPSTNTDYSQDKNTSNITPGFGHHFPSQQPMMPGPPLQQSIMAGYGPQQGQYHPSNYPGMPYPPTSSYQPPYQPPPYEQSYSSPYSAFHRPDMLPYPPPSEGYGPPPPGPPFGPMRQGFHPSQYPPYPQAPPPHQPMYPGYSDPTYNQYNPGGPPPAGFNQYINHSYTSSLPNLGTNPNPPSAP